MAEAFTVYELRCGPLRQHGAFFRRRYDHQGRAACRRIWALRLASCFEHLHYGVTVDDALADGGIRRPREHGDIHGVGWLSERSFGLRNSLALFS